MMAYWIELGQIGYIFEWAPSKNYSCQIWFKLVKLFQRRIFFFAKNLFCNLKKYKLCEKPGK